MENNRWFLAAAILIAFGLMGMVTFTWFGSLQDPGGWSLSMMGGGMMGQSMMRGMMHRMIPDLVPPGVGPEDLPDPNSQGARLLVYYCARCHNLPSPSMHTAEEWPAVADRMFLRMSRTSGMGGMGMMSVEIPSPEEEQAIVAYLKAHSLKSISPGTLPSPESQGATLFRERCSQCHSLPDPKLHTPTEWPAIVEKMRAYMQSMDRKGVTGNEEKEIVSYLQSHSRK
jgi:mono/diheme cytochrome c family protein